MTSDQLVSALGVASVLLFLLWPRKGGHARYGVLLILVASVLLLVAVLPITSLEHVTRQAQADEARSLRIAAEAAVLERHELQQEVQRLTTETEQLRRSTSDELVARAREFAELEQNLRRALEQVATISNLAGTEVVTLSSAALFESGEKDLSCESRERLSRLVPWLTLRYLNEPDLVVLVEGHTDNKGTLEYNKALSLNRAESVKSYLAGAGLNGDRIETQGLWFSRPAGSESAAAPDQISAKNLSENDRKRNRRVEIRELRKPERRLPSG